MSKVKTCLYCPAQFTVEYGSNGRQLVCEACKDLRRKLKYRERYLRDREKLIARGKLWAKANPEKRKKSTRECYERNIDRVKKRAKMHREMYPEYYRAIVMKSKLKHHYGLSVEDYECLCARQNNKCRICGELFTKRPNVDHCHTTGKVRGLLCRSCNTGLGMFTDSQIKLRAAIHYLDSWMLDSLPKFDPNEYSDLLLLPSTEENQKVG